MMQQQQPLQTCPNCGKPVSPNTALCPNCGAALTNVPPIPILGLSPVATDVVALWTGSRKGDIAVGIALGIVAPMVIPVLISVASYLNSSFGAVVSLIGGIGQLFLPFVAAYLLKKRYPVAGDAMMKTLLFLILAGILVLLGLLVACLTGIIKI